MQPKAAESLRIATELDRLERDVKMSRAAVSYGQEPRLAGLELPSRLEEWHRAQLAMFARALLREWLEGAPPTISTWVSDTDDPLCQRRLAVIEAVQKQITTWEADKAAGRLRPPAHDAAKYGDAIVDDFDKQQRGR